MEVKLSQCLTRVTSKWKQDAHSVREHLCTKALLKEQLPSLYILSNSRHSSKIAIIVSISAYQPEAVDLSCVDESDA